MNYPTESMKHYFETKGGHFRQLVLSYVGKELKAGRTPYAKKHNDP